MFEISKDGLLLTEIFDDVTLDQLKKSTECDFKVVDKLVTINTNQI